MPCIGHNLILAVIVHRVEHYVRPCNDAIQLQRAAHSCPDHRCYTLKYLRIPIHTHAVHDIDNSSHTIIHMYSRNLRVYGQHLLVEVAGKKLQSWNNHGSLQNRHAPLHVTHSLAHDLEAWCIYSLTTYRYPGSLTQITLPHSDTQMLSWHTGSTDRLHPGPELILYTLTSSHAIRHRTDHASRSSRFPRTYPHLNEVPCYGLGRPVFRLTGLPEI